MKNKICPKCNRIMTYDPYFKANICRQCGTTEKVKMVELTPKRIIEAKYTLEKKIVLTR